MHRSRPAAAQRVLSGWRSIIESSGCKSVVALLADD
jgi:hypothetical protein